MLNITSSIIQRSTSEPALNGHSLRRSISLPQMFTTDRARIAEDLATAARPDSPQVTGQQAEELLGGMSRALLDFETNTMSLLGPDEQEVVLVIENLIENPEYAGSNARPRTAAHALLEEARQYLRGLQTSTPYLRAIAMVDYLCSLLRMVTRNEFQGNFGRWMANATNVGVRTGLIVGLTTTMRQLIGFGIEKAQQLGGLSFPSRTVIGAAAMLLGPGLNLVGVIRDEVNQIATVQSRVARVAMMLLSVGAIVATSQVAHPSVLASHMSSFGPQVASYCLARDIVQMFFPLNDNAPINLKGTIAEALIYSGVQMAVGEGMDALAPSSGAGMVMSAAAMARQVTESPTNSATSAIVDWFTSSLSGSATNITATAPIRDRVSDAIRALQPAFGQDVTRGVLNAAAEIADDILRPSISRAVHVNQSRDAARREVIAGGNNPEAELTALPRDANDGLRVSASIRFPNRTQIADQFFTTNAMRTSAFETIMGAAMSAATILGYTNLSNENQGHVVNAVVAGTIALIYPPFIYAHVQRTPATTPVEHTSDVAQDSSQEAGMELRQRHFEGTDDLTRLVN